MDGLNLVVDDDSSRSTIFDPVFRDGYSVGWHFVVREAFALALDIRLTRRVANKDRPKGEAPIYTQILTQGDRYSFRAGDVIYDSPKATEPGVRWSEALRCFTQRIKITLATDGPDGSVHFEIQAPDREAQAVYSVSNHIVTQAEFVRFLKTGELPLRQ